MSKENVEIVRRFYDAPPPGAPGSLEVAHELLDPEIDWEVVSNGPRLAFHGAQAVVEFLRDWYQGFDELQMEPEEIIDLGDDRVLALVYQHGQMKGGSGLVEERTAHLLTLRAERIARFQGFLSREQGFEAAGLAE